ncbi:Outer membrane protein OmpA [Daejeonella rubra]|uniref:Outer membrane protein OmpA n=1 Tax=Daejeonella rubra TaxID=990371 RepID=A0A1G9Q4B7_9SPHI|nr:OmpA family protein [Daejeonella rubra]SDM05826.1 Outer membrane protein OmpA [Daejeonella rubra]
MKRTNLRIATFGLAIATSTLLFQGCATATKTQKGAVIGAATGGTLGAIIGKKAGNTAVGAIIGGAIGGTAGALIGRKMDRQAEEIKQSIPNAEVIREGEGIIVKFDSGILFDVNQNTLKTNARSNIESLATSLKNNPETTILIVGHTDATGTDAYNLKLSERRAAAVRSYTIAQGITASRLTTEGRGESEAIADNTTEEGRALNRRVEIVIVANETMKQEAKSSVQ